MARVTDSTNISRVALKNLYALIPGVFTGLGVGLATWLIFGLLYNTILYFVACQAHSVVVACTERADIASALALILGGFAGLVALARYRVYRPLLVVIASVASLWALPKLLLGMSWYGSLAATVLAMTAVYALFTWINDFRRFAVALVVAAAVVVGLRLLLVA